jgi:hypothetical protein
MISLTEILKEIEEFDQITKEPKTFSCTVITCDLDRDKGGEILTLHNVRLNKISKKAKEIREKQTEESISILPNEKKNATRNLLLQNGEIRKIHIHLIIKFNGQEVII